MKPSELSSALRRIASGIESSERPSRSAVAAEVRRVAEAVRTAGVSYWYNGKQFPMDSGVASDFSLAFQALGLPDWTEAVEEDISPELAAEIRAGLGEALSRPDLEEVMAEAADDEGFDPDVVNDMRDFLAFLS